MTTTAPPDQKTIWNQTSGRAWAELEALMDRLNQPIAEVLVARAFPGVGGRVLDVGCGAGATTLAMAERLGPEGLCLGVDISAPLLEAARAKAEGVASARFVEADAQTYDGEGERFDAIFSRYGVMFFDDFDAAFANLRRLARPGAELVFACWRSPAENPLAQVAMTAAAPFLPPQPQPDPNAPGRFAFADRNRVQGILERSGWSEIEIQPLDAPTPIAVEDMVRMSLRMGPVAQALRDQDEEVRAKVEDAVRAAIEARAEGGVVPMAAACWLVTARAP